jgi:hypothetical protein
VVIGCLALRQKAYRPSGTLELCLKRRNPNSVHPVRLLYPYFGFRETATGSTMSLKGRSNGKNSPNWIEPIVPRVT